MFVCGVWLEQVVEWTLSSITDVAMQVLREISQVEAMTAEAKLDAEERAFLSAFKPRHDHHIDQIALSEEVASGLVEPSISSLAPSRTQR